MGKYSTAGEAIELAKANGFDLRVAASEIKVAYGTALMELARSMIKDKQFKQFIRVTSRVGEETFVIDGGFTSEEAMRISKNAKLNYFEQEKKSSIWNLINL